MVVTREPVDPELESITNAVAHNIQIKDNCDKEYKKKLDKKSRNKTKPGNVEMSSISKSC